MTLSDLSIKDHRVQKIAGGILIFGIILVLWYMQIYSPNKQTIQEKRESLEQLNLKLANVKLSAAKLPQLRKQVEKLFVRYKLLEELLPTRRDVPDIINRLTVAARENNAQLKQMDVEPSDQGQYYFTDPYRVKVVSNYHELGGFMESVANLDFIVNASNMSMKKTNAGRATVTADFTLKSYHIPEDSRLQKPSEISVSGPSQSAIAKPRNPRSSEGGDEGGGRASEEDALRGVSGGLGPAPE